MTPGSSSSDSDSSMQEPSTPDKGTLDHRRTTPDRAAKHKAAMAKAAATTNNKKKTTRSMKKLPTSRNKKTKATMPKKRKAAPSSASSTETKSKKKKKPNYTDVEDLALCKAYANVSTDPIHSTHQKGSCFWNEIKVKYDNFVIEVN